MLKYDFDLTLAYFLFELFERRSQPDALKLQIYCFYFLFRYNSLPFRNTHFDVAEIYNISKYTSPIALVFVNQCQNWALQQINPLLLIDTFWYVMYKIHGIKGFNIILVPFKLNSQNDLNLRRHILRVCIYCWSSQTQSTVFQTLKLIF